MQKYYCLMAIDIYDFITHRPHSAVKGKKVTSQCSPYTDTIITPREYPKDWAAGMGIYIFDLYVGECVRT